jgi:hypothetical protein
MGASGSMWRHLGCIWRHLGGIWKHLEASGKHLETSGTIRRQLEASGRHLGSIWEASGTSRHLEDIWEASGRHLGDKLPRCPPTSRWAEVSEAQKIDTTWWLVTTTSPLTKLPEPLQLKTVWGNMDTEQRIYKLINP